MEYGNGNTNCLVWRTTENRYHHEEDNLTIENVNVNISILGREIASHSCVLDVGCGEGKLSEPIKEKSCSIYGIDVDRAAIQYALEKKRYLDAFHFNIEHPSENIDEYERFERLGLKFDYIVIADIIEHTVNPTKVLCEISRFLKSNGKILVSVPNINNADIILNLLRGRFNYMQAGILDNTHTKYFTKSSFVEWIDESNSLFEDFSYDCYYLGGTFGLTEYLNHVKETMPLLFQTLQLNPEYNVIQNLFILYKRDKNTSLPGLEALLTEKRPDLAQILSDVLEKGIDEQFVRQIGEIKPLSNERTLLEERALSSETGWEKCNKQLILCEQELEKIAVRNTALEKEHKWLLEKQEELLCGWKKCNESAKKLQIDNSRLSEDIHDKDQWIDKLQTDIEQLTGEIQAKDQWADKLQADIGQLTGEIQAKDQWADKLQTDIELLNDIIHKQDQVKHQLQTNIEQLRNDLYILQQELTREQQEKRLLEEKRRLLDESVRKYPLRTGAKVIFKRSLINEEKTNH